MKIQGLNVARLAWVLSTVLICAGCASHPTYRVNYADGSGSLAAGNSSPAFSSTPAASPESQSQFSASPEPLKDSRSTTIVPARTPVQNHDFSSSGTAGSSSGNSSFSGRTGSVWAQMDLIMGPKNVIARPGSEVILTAGIRDRSGYLRTNQRIDWNIAPNSVGHFSKIQDRQFSNLLVFDFVKPQILSDTQAVTTTSRSELILDRGTEYLNDDIVVRRGESWISVSSPREGVTLVTASASQIPDSPNRSQTSRIIWVDAAVKLPESRVLDFGSTYTLTTALRRVSNEEPLERWRVRYQICGNSTAVFGDGNKMLEVFTNRQGEAKIEMHQPIAREEETTVNIQIIRPADEDFVEPVVVKDSKLHFRWKPNTINIQKSMQTEAHIGDVIPAVIFVTNLTNQTLQNVRVVDVQQPGLVLKGAVPPGQDAMDGRQWLIDSLEPHSTYTIQLNYRVEQPGTYLSFSQVQTQKTGNDLVVECSARLSAGSETSPYTPEMPKNSVIANPTPDSNSTPTFEQSGETADPFDSSTKALPPPPDDSEDVYVPDGSTNGKSSGTENTRNPAASGKTDSSNPYSVPPRSTSSEIAAKDPVFAPVFPKQDPEALVKIELLVPAKIRVGEQVAMYLELGNYMQQSVRDVKIRVENSNGLSNQNPKGDLTLIERNLPELPAQKMTRIRSNFKGITPGNQTIAVTLTLPNGKEYYREARPKVTDGTDSEIAAPEASETPTPSKASAPSEAAAPLESPVNSGINEGSDSRSNSTPIPEAGSGSESTDSIPLPVSGVNSDASLPSVPSTPSTPSVTSVPSASDAEEVTIPKISGSKGSAESVTTPPNTTQSSNADETIGSALGLEVPQADSTFNIVLKESKPKITVGDEFLYTLEVTNKTSGTLKEIVIQLAISPENAEIQKNLVKGPSKALVNTTDGVVRFEPLPEIVPGKKIQCEIPLKALKAGTFQTHIQILKNGIPESQKTKETTIK